MPPQQLVGLPMRKTRSQQAREISAMMLMKTPHAHLLQAQPGAAMVHPNAAPLLPLPTQQAAMNMAAPSLRMPNQTLPPAPAPLPLQASVSDIASAFGLESDHLDTSAPLQAHRCGARARRRASPSPRFDLGQQARWTATPRLRDRWRRSPCTRHRAWRTAASTRSTRCRTLIIRARPSSSRQGASARRAEHYSRAHP